MLLTEQNLTQGRNEGTRKTSMYFTSSFQVFLKALLDKSDSVNWKIWKLAKSIWMRTVCRELSPYFLWYCNTSIPTNQIFHLTELMRRVKSFGRQILFLSKALQRLFKKTQYLQELNKIHMQNLKVGSKVGECVVQAAEYLAFPTIYPCSLP